MAAAEREARIATERSSAKEGDAAATSAAAAAEAAAAEAKVAQAEVKVAEAAAALDVEMQARADAETELAELQVRPLTTTPRSPLYPIQHLHTRVGFAQLHSFGRRSWCQCKLRLHEGRPVCSEQTR